ncbi:MAG TPA: tetratricopeptide repeat protein [Gemmataceae bacterium]|nr:tetratricopeptide repeat protein [Gemmataceae bacterium]
MSSIEKLPLGRARRRFSQLWQVPAFLLGLFVFLGVAVSAPWRLTPQQRELAHLMAELRAGINKEEPGDGDRLVAQAETLLRRVGEHRAEAGEIHFLAGCAYYRQARQKPPSYAKLAWGRALEQLEQAHALGVADTDRPLLQYRLGNALLQQNRELPRALELLMLSVEKGGESPLAGYQLLVQGYLGLPKPDVDSALKANQRILDLTPARDSEALAAAYLQQAEILLRKDQRVEAVKALEQVGSKASRPVRVKAKLLQARCLEEDGRWDKAIAIWKELLPEASQVEGGRARVQYRLGSCCVRVEPRATADAIRAWSDALKIGGFDGQAAGLRLGELRLSLGAKESTQALADWKQALANVNGPDDYKNPHIELKSVRDWLDQAIAQFQKAGDPQKTQDVAELYRKVAPGGTAEKVIAEAAEALAEQMRDQLEAGGTKVSAAEVQSQYRRGAEAYAEAAKVRPESERPDMLWRSAQCYLSAKDAALTQKTLHQHVLVEKNELRLAEAWCILGDLYRTQGKGDAARQAYIKSREYPSQFRCKSGYYLALEEIDKKNLTQAYQILKETVDATGSVDRSWQERAQYKLAGLLMQMQKFEEARIQLTECLQVYGGNSGALAAREQLGECYRRLAEKEEKKEKEIDKLVRTEQDPMRRLRMEDDKRSFHNRRRDLLQEAAKTYQKLADDLENRPREKLTRLEDTLLRRALFGIGECHLDGEEYYEALNAFKKLQTSRRRTLESFYACLRICNMPDLIGNMGQAALVRDDAKDSLRMLTEDLKSLPDGHEIFRTPGVSSRADWLGWTQKMQMKLQGSAPKADTKLPVIQ